MKRVWIVFLILVLIVGIYVFLPGFFEESSAYILEYSVSGDTMTVHTGVGSSVGFIRTVKAKAWQDGKVDLTFYRAFGGINGSLGAKNEFSFELPENARMIRVYRGNQCYEEVMTFDPESGEWIR